MELDLPSHLHSVRDRLTESLGIHPTDGAPEAPFGLLEDLERQFDSPVLQPLHQTRSWRESLRSFFASPAFGIAAAAAVVLAVAMPSLLEQPVDTFRGGPVTTRSGKTVQIILVQEPSGIRHLVETSGDIEAVAVASVDDSATCLSIKGPKVIVDFAAGVIRSVDAEGNELYRNEEIPEDTADLTTAIAVAVTYL